jgi:thioredoxin-related protein
MKKIIIFALLFVCVTSVFAQTPDAPLPPYKLSPTVPPLKLMRADSSFFVVKDMVKKKMATVVIIFSPTCIHCQHQAEEITSHIGDFKDVNFIFSTTYDVKDMKQYISDYGLDKFPNITVGYDKGYIMGSFYKIQSLPGIFLYDKKGHFVTNFETNVKAQTLLDALAKKTVTTPTK